MKITVNANSLRAAMASAADKKETRDYLQWICLDLDCNPPMIVATDGHAMVEAPVSVEFGLPESRELRTGKVLFQVSRKLPRLCEVAVVDTVERKVTDAHRGDFKTPVFIGGDTAVSHQAKLEQSGAICLGKNITQGLQLINKTLNTRQPR